MRLRTRVLNLLPDDLQDLYVAMRVHKTHHGRYPNLMRPRTFNEWIARRKALDRRPILTCFADKYAVREFVSKRVGSHILTELYCVTRDVAEIPFDSLPNRFVVKPTHGSGWVTVVRDKSQLDRDALLKQCRTWLASDYYKLRREWPYKNVVPQIIIEEFIDNGATEPASDVRFYVFGGKVELIQVDVGRFVGHERAFLDQNWNELPIKMRYPPVAAGVPKPPHLAEMLQIAEALGKDVDFVRVDLYDTGRRIVFGEITTTPVCGCGQFEPQSIDVQLGRLWELSAREN
jgi:TupA-like ATPgrasp